MGMARGPSAVRTHMTSTCPARSATTRSIALRERVGLRWASCQPLRSGRARRRWLQPNGRGSSPVMSDKRSSKLATLRQRATVFAALGDETRLSVLAQLSRGEPRSIARLTAGTRLTRQAVTKHLRVLENAGVVRSARAGRESLFELEPRSLADVRDYLDDVSRQWDDALARLRSFLDE